MLTNIVAEESGGFVGQIPHIDDLDPAWLAARLGLNESCDVDVSPIGSGQVANCYRVAMLHDGVQIASAVAKTPSSDPTSRATASLQQLYLRETSFYQHLAPIISTRTPHCFAVEHDDDDNFFLLLEDMHPAHLIDQFDGLDEQMAKIGLAQLAALHGPTMHRGELHDARWLNGVSNALRPLYSAVVPTLFTSFLERYEASVSASTYSFVEKLGEDLELFSAYHSDFACVTHGDFRTDNLLFDAKATAVPLCVVDWQTVAVSSPMLDVAYFLTTSLGVEERERLEMRLLDFYLDELTVYGVDYPREVMLSEYARYTLQPIVMLVAAAGLVERTERGDRMFLTMIERGVRAATSWQSLDQIEHDAAS